MKNKAVVILGPTASGKSALSLKIAKKVKVEIISLDSALIYKDMDIGTAKPTREELASVPHHLISRAWQASHALKPQVLSFLLS